MELTQEKAQEIFNQSVKEGTALPERAINTHADPRLLKDQHNNHDPRHRLSIPKRKRRRIHRARRPKELQIPRKPHTPQHLIDANILDRQEKVWRMKADESKTSKEIAVILGVSEQTIWKDMKDVSRIKCQSIVDRAEVALAESEARYEQLLSKWVAFVTDPDLVVGETKVDREGKEYDITLPKWQALKDATDAICKVLKQREALLGLTDTKKSTGPAKEIGEGLASFMITMQNLAKQSLPQKAEIIKSETVINDSVSSS